MLLQIHFEFADGHTEFVEQNFVEDEESARHWINDVLRAHDLPGGAKWVILTQDSPHFILQASKGIPDGRLDG